MVKLTKASELAKFTKTKEVEFEQNAINSAYFNNLVSDIESVAEQGGYQILVESRHYGGPQVFTVFEKYLKEAGYKLTYNFGVGVTISWQESK